MALLQQIKNKNKKWFSPSNKRFFGDVSYKAGIGKKSETIYLFQYTTRWSDMLNKKNLTYSYAVHKINNDFSMGDLLDVSLKDWDAVISFLEQN